MGERVLFDASTSRDPDGRIIDYIWDLNSDGRIDARGVTVTTVYTAAGPQRVTLTVIDDKGASNSVSQIVPVRPGRPQPPSQDPTASITVDKGCGPTGRPYRIGETIIISYTVSEAAVAVLYDFGPTAPTTGTLQTINLGSVPGGQPQSLTARVFGAPGVETLVLQATTLSGRVITAACSFSVEGVSPALAQITVNKGCDAIYSIGESISISYNVNVDVIRVRVFNIVPRLGVVELTSAPLTSRSGVLNNLPPVGPDSGDRMLALVAVTNSGLLTATCRYKTAP